MTLDNSLINDTFMYPYAMEYNAPLTPVYNSNYICYNNSNNNINNNNNNNNRMVSFFYKASRKSFKRVWYIFVAWKASAISESRKVRQKNHDSISLINWYEIHLLTTRYYSKSLSTLHAKCKGISLVRENRHGGFSQMAEFSYFPTFFYSLNNSKQNTFRLWPVAARSIIDSETS